MSLLILLERVTIKRKQKEENKWLKKIQSMSDEEILEQERKLYIKYGLLSGGCIALFIFFLVLFLLVVSGL